ncbi:ribonuclease H-like domain-containing protein [Tanacetum coccineum]
MTGSSVVEKKEENNNDLLVKLLQRLGMTDKMDSTRNNSSSTRPPVQPIIPTAFYASPSPSLFYHPEAQYSSPSTTVVPPPGFGFQLASPSYFALFRLIAVPVEVMRPTAAPGQPATIFNAFTTWTLHDLSSGAWNMDTYLVSYSDTDWAGCPTTRRSTLGYCVFLGNNLLSWSSKRQSTLSRSSAEAEYRGVANAFAETCCNLLRELHTPLSSAILVYSNNVSAIYLSCNPVQHQRTKHIEIDIHFVRDLVAAGQVRVLHVPSRYQFVDIFTKGLSSALFEEFHSSLSVKSMLNSSTGLFSFQFSSMDGLDAMLENEDVGNVPVWVKLHGVPVMTLSEDGLVMIELPADMELKDTIVVAMPKLVREEFYMCTIHVEYEWKPPRCHEKLIIDGKVSLVDEEKVDYADNPDSEDKVEPVNN